ncbi:hypothetical protein Q3304_09110 [Clostridioides sp. GD02377]|uniref:hypothetical protein n=1 Tax=unclassified Clostridioides TaxID=2635829 RepID=UPI00389FF03D
MIKFMVNKAYYSKSICDSNCISVIFVIRRTPKCIVYKDSDNITRRSKIRIMDDCEFISPENYSFANIFKANREY